MMTPDLTEDLERINALIAASQDRIAGTHALMSVARQQYAETVNNLAKIHLEYPNTGEIR